MATLFDFMSEEDYARYNEIIGMAEEAKANAPKPVRAPRGPMTQEQKIKLQRARLEKAQAKLDALLAEMNG